MEDIQENRDSVAAQPLQFRGVPIVTSGIGRTIVANDILIEVQLDPAYKDDQFWQSGQLILFTKQEVDKSDEGVDHFIDRIYAVLYIWNTIKSGKRAWGSGNKNKLYPQFQN